MNIYLRVRAAPELQALLLAQRDRVYLLPNTFNT